MLDETALFLHRVVADLPVRNRLSRPAALSTGRFSKSALCLTCSTRPLLDEVGLLSALAWYAEGLTKRSGIEAFVDVQSQDFPRLAPEVETAVFRIVQEALTNVFRHSEARKVWISLHQKNGAILVSVLDDGKGIDQRIAELRPGKVGVGIGGIKQRALEFGGELRLSNTHPGALLGLTIPSTSTLREPKAVLNGCL